MKDFTFTKYSHLTGKKNTRTIKMTQSEYNLVTDPMRSHLIQVILPNHSSDDREFLISGCTPEEWKEFMESTEEFPGK